MMGKWNWKSFVVGVTAGGLLFSGVSYAAPLAVKMIVDGRIVHSEVPPQIVDGSTLIPARALAEALGAEVNWDEANQTVTIKSDAYRTIHSAQKLGFNERTAVVLAGIAQRKYFELNSGGSGDVLKNADGGIQTFPVKDRPYDYRWMGSDVNTKAKYIDYLEQLSTPEQAKAYWEKQISNGSIVEVDGKLAQPNVDGGSILDWNEAKAVFLEDGADHKTFRLTLRNEYVGTQTRELNVRYVEGKGWRIDDPFDTYY
jgi:hypothetical protein